MNSDQVSGKFDQIKGKVKQGVGEAVGDQRLANQGVADQVKGAAKEVWGNAKDAVHQSAEASRIESHERADHARANVVDHVAAAREHANAVIDDRR
jgi:uncharacterized protein YjbJ (UPF0337 family)